MSDETTVVLDKPMPVIAPDIGKPLIEVLKGREGCYWHFFHCSGSRFTLLKRLRKE
jgi:hypothetical protein